MDINNLITRLRDIAWDFPPEHSINRAADMLTVLQAENNKLQDELRRREAEIARLNEACEIANEKAREYESRAEMVKEQETIINNVCRNLNEFKTSHNKLLKMCQELGNFDRLRELAEADKEGRCVVLPCKVFQYDSERIYELEVRNIIYDCGYIAFDKNAIDKSVFLTREAAETALKEREQNE